MQISCFFPHIPPHPIWVSIGGSDWQQLLLLCFLGGDFLFLSLSIFINQNYSPFLFIQFFIYISLYLWMFILLYVL